MEIPTFLWFRQWNVGISRCVHDEVGASVGKRRTDGWHIPHPTSLSAPPAGQEQSGAETGERGDLRAFLQFSLLLCIQLDGEGRDIFFEMGDRTGAGNQHHLG